MDDRNVTHRYSIHRTVRCKQQRMNKEMIKDKLFSILNDTHELYISTIEVEDENDLLHVYLMDGTRFSVRLENYGSWCICGG